MKDFIDGIKAKAKADPKRIVFPESTEERTLKAVAEVIKEGTASPVLIGNPEEIWGRINELGLEITDDKIQIVNHMCAENKNHFDSYVQEFYEIRKEKGMTTEAAAEHMHETIYYGTMMVHKGDADGLVSGAIHSTGHTILPALQIIKTKKKFHKVSGVFFIKYKDEVVLFADAAVTIDPDAKDLAGIALDTAHTAERFGIAPRVAMLSFSTKGSAHHPAAKKIIEATEIAIDRAKEEMPHAVIDGEMQLDAAVEPWVAKIKCPHARIQGDANILVFPDLQSANIGYKLATFFGKAEAIGPLLQGLNKPVNDLSRGCTVKEIVSITAFTVVEAQSLQE